MGEVCSVTDTDQFEQDKTVDACGFYSVALLKFAGRPGASPSGNASQIAAWADSEYVTYDGPDTSTNFNGMVMQTLFDVLHDAGLHYQVIGSNELNYHTERMTADYIRAWLRLGYPVILAVAESNVYDQDLGGSPYAWNTAGYYHIITCTGYEGSNTLLCHDTASIDANGVRRGPRRYDANKLQAGLTSATAVAMSWLQRPTGDYDPIANGGHMIPNGWRDDGKTLTAPNGVPVVAGFRDHVLNFPGGWDANDWPLAPEQTLAETELAIHSNEGSLLIFRTKAIAWYALRGVVTIWTGAELYAWMQRSLAQTKQIADLQAQLKAAQTPIAPSKIDVPAAIAAIGALSKDVTTLKTALSIQ